MPPASTSLGPAPNATLHEAAMLQWINDFAPYGVITTDKDLKIQSWNRWMSANSGRPFAEVLNRSLLEVFPDLKDRGLTARFERALSGEVSVLSTALHSYLVPMLSSTREAGFDQMQQTARIGPLVLQSEIVGLIIVIDDVTQREAQALLLRRQHERDALLSWALAHLLEAQEPRRSIRELFCRVAEHSDFDGYLLYLREDSSAFRLQAYGGILPELEESIATLQQGGKGDALYQAIAGSKTACACEHLKDAPASSLRAPLHKMFGFEVCCLLPLDTADGTIGVFVLGARNRPALLEGELELLSTIGKYLAVALHKEATNSELLRAQAKLNQHALELERQVNERTATLRDIISELETFSYTLAHDLRAPIRALIGYSEALLEDYTQLLPGEGIDLLQRLRRACKQLDRLTRDLLEFSKVSRQDIQLEKVDLEEIVAAVLSLLPEAQASVTVVKPLHSVLGHPGLVQQCIWNLVDNALKFVKEGQVPKVKIWTEVTADEKLHPGHALTPPFSPARRLQGITPGADRQRGQVREWVRVFVADEGIGIDPKAHAKIFGIFERGTSSMRFSGSGIGLAIVARAVQKMGGTCGVESNLGVGSRFWLELPCA